MAVTAIWRHRTLVFPTPPSGLVGPKPDPVLDDGPVLPERR